MKKIFTKIFTHKDLPFVELRYSNSNTHYKKHFHDTFSLGVNKEGISIYMNTDKEYILKENRLSIINPKAVHSCNSCSDILNVYYMLYLNTSWCKNIQSLINEDIKEFTNIPSHILEDKVFFHKYLELCDYLFSKNTVFEKENELIVFFFDFFSLYLEENKSILTDTKFQEIISYLDLNYKENISLENLSKTFDLNPFYIIRLFKSQMNLTPHAYLLNVKINKAKEFIRNGYSLVDTALECGFFDQSHFHRNFLKIVAITPKEYKLNFVQ